MLSNNENIQQFTIFQSHYKPIADVSFLKIVEVICSTKFKDRIEDIQNFITQGKVEEAKKIKQKLDAFTPSGVFKDKRRAEYLQSYSRLIVLDIDNLDKTVLNDSLMKAKSLEYTRCYFISPSGNGIKIFVKVDSEKENHKDAFGQVAELYEQELNVKIDRSGSDITRLCYVPYDPNLYLNENSSIFHVDIKTDNSNVQVKQPVENVNSYAQYLNAVKYTKNVAKYEDHDRNNFIYTLAKNCNARNINIEDAIAV